LPAILKSQLVDDPSIRSIGILVVFGDDQGYIYHLLRLATEIRRPIRRPT
jgi:hypothetical protein